MPQLQLVDVDLAKLHVRVDVDDAEINSKLDMASSMILKYLKVTASTLPDTWYTGSPAVLDVPGDVQAATLLVLGELFDNRESGTSNPLNQTVKDLLVGHRDPAMA